MNIVVIKGRLTKDPELKYTSQGDAVSSFDIAYNHTKDKTSFFQVQAWKKTAENINKYFKKGNEIIIEGELQQQSWTSDKDNSKHSKIIINAYKFDFVGYSEKKIMNEPEISSEKVPNPWEEKK